MIYNLNVGKMKMAEQWKTIRGFVENWYQIPLSNLEQTHTFEDKEWELGMVLPDTIREYISLSTELLRLDTYHILRDCFEINFLEEHEAVSLMVQGEGDFYWAVPIADLHTSSPKVYGYALDLECFTQEKFVFVGELFPSVTSFFLNHCD